MLVRVTNKALVLVQLTDPIFTVFSLGYINRLKALGIEEFLLLAAKEKLVKKLARQKCWVRRSPLWHARLHSSGERRHLPA